MRDHFTRKWVRDMLVTIYVSRKWDAKEAASELVANARAAHGTGIQLCLLFSTIHYRSNGGFTALVRTVFEGLNEAPLVGGTVAGFSTKEGSFSRGALPIAFSGNN